MGAPCKHAGSASLRTLHCPSLLQELPAGQEQPDVHESLLVHSFCSSRGQSWQGVRRHVQVFRRMQAASQRAMKFFKLHVRNAGPVPI